MRFFEEVFGKYSRARVSQHYRISRSPSTTPSSSLRPSRVMKPQPAGRPYLRDDHLGWSVTTNLAAAERVGQSDAVAGDERLGIVDPARAPSATGQCTSNGSSSFYCNAEGGVADRIKGVAAGAIAPVDLPQAAIGPGMAVFSRYSAVLEDDGSTMPVRAALARINEVLDEVLTAQEGDFDSDTRFAIGWFRQFGFDPGPYGDADNIARALNASIDHLDQAGILTSRAGKVTLLAPEKLDAGYDPATDRQSAHGR